MKKSILLLLTVSFLLQSCSSVDQNSEKQNTVSSGSDNKEIPATEITETGSVFVDTGSTTQSGAESDDSTPPESTGVFVQ